MDLEWNNTYSKKRQAYFNEVIEVGAVKLDEQLQEVDSFSMLVNSGVTKKLRKYVTQLTHIQTDDLQEGQPFSKVLSQFRKWVGETEHVLLTWADGDIRVLLDNTLFFIGAKTLPFMQNYADLQAYIQTALQRSNANQIGLGAAAQELGIPFDEEQTHRALEDCRISAACMRAVWPRLELRAFIMPCDKQFYERLAFKTHVISRRDNPKIDQSLLQYQCETCGNKRVKQQTDWHFRNQYFRAEYYCPQCEKTVQVRVRFKEYYDRVETKKTIVEMMPKELVTTPAAVGQEPS